ncbi:hypothetical protein MNBD_CHLOROFLEXI01-4826 [hydrothermal vent metagenome]|uniref:Serine kinase of the HPr protein, regulates carbohydrate metabolism n=1 Tax=hydrothermal vent metagenome TaxID=652676 RepID=A0A3B0VN66_9ZZZZ
MQIKQLLLEVQLDQAKLEDFWRRRANQLQFERSERLFGHLLTVKSNQLELLTAVTHLLPLYSQSTHKKRPLGIIQLVVQPSHHSLASVPENLMQQITYSGSDDWLMIRLGAWGQAHLDLTDKRATAVLDPQLAARPDLVAQCLLHTLVLNLIIAQGYGMLHASCLLRDDVALLLLAPHNTGKSTTALRLALAGYPLLTDSMVFADETGLHGFPIGTIKLRADMVPHFPSCQPFLQTELVRSETKYRLDLRRMGTEFVQETAVQPKKVILCLLARHDMAESVVEDVTETAVTQAILHNSLYVDQPHIWQQNIANLRELLVGGTAVQLTIGTNPESLQEKVGKLFGY